MSIVDTLRKGFGYVLLSMGVSRPAEKAKPKPATNPESKPQPGASAEPTSKFNP